MTRRAAVRERRHDGVLSPQRGMLGGVRIVAGVARGRPLAVPARGTRPTSDRTREALFSALESLRGPFAGARVLDLYAGSGALGLEALSRGAAHVLLVESDRQAAEVARRNAATVGLPGADVRVRPVAGVVAEIPDAPYDVVLADPPYALAAAALAQVVTALVEHGWLAPEAVVVVERSSRDPAWEWPPGIAAVRERRYGEGTLWYGRAS